MKTNPSGEGSELISKCALVAFIVLLSALIISRWNDTTYTRVPVVAATQPQVDIENPETSPASAAPAEPETGNDEKRASLALLETFKAGGGRAWNDFSEEEKREISRSLADESTHGTSARSFEDGLNESYNTSDSKILAVPTDFTSQYIEDSH